MRIYEYTKPKEITAQEFYNSFYYNLLCATKYLQKWLQSSVYKDYLETFQQACNSIMYNFYFYTDSNAKEFSTFLLIRAIEALPDKQKFIFVYVFQSFLMNETRISLGCDYDWEDMEVFEQLQKQIVPSCNAIFSEELLRYFLNIIYKPMYGLTLGFDEGELYCCTDFGFISDKYKLGLDNRHMPRGSIWFNPTPTPLPSIFNM